MRKDILSWLAGAVSPKVADEIDKHLSEPHRIYHGWYHIEMMWKSVISNRERWSDEARLAVLYHDIVYNIPSSRNEDDSAELMERHLAGSNYDTGVIRNLIMATKPSNWRRGESWLAARDFVVNLDLLAMHSASDALAAGALLAREFQLYGWQDYRAATERIMNDMLFHECKPGVDAMKGWLASFRPRVGIYAGTFDPFHAGHASVVRRADEIFDKVVIVCAVNPKKNSERVEKRAEEVRRVLPYHEVWSWQGLVVEFIKFYRQQGCVVSLIRGLRTDTDFAQEEINRRWMEGLMPDVSVSYIPCDVDKQHVSSSGITALADFDGAESVLRSLMVDTDAYYRAAREAFMSGR